VRSREPAQPPWARATARARAADGCQEKGLRGYLSLFRRRRLGAPSVVAGPEREPRLHRRGHRDWHMEVREVWVAVAIWGVGLETEAETGVVEAWVQGRKQGIGRVADRVVGLVGHGAEVAEELLLWIKEA